MLEKKRIVSGIPRLDYLLDGGFLRQGLYVLMGPPGSGKTILSNQLAFEAINHSDDSCVYITLTTESQSKMVSHLESLHFFDPDQIGKRIFYVSGRCTLMEEGLETFTDLIRSSVKKFNARILVIDGIEAIEAKSKGKQETFLNFIHNLQSYCSLAGTTCFLIRTILGSGVIVPESTVADGVIEMHMREEGPRLVRELSIHKLRGSGMLPGRHEVEINKLGVIVHPRTEIQFDVASDGDQGLRSRISFGVDELNQMLNGGIWSSSSTCLLGSPGTGKTIIGSSFLQEGAKKGEKGIYFGFYEPPKRLIEKVESVGFEFQKYVEDGSIQIMWQAPLEKYMDSLAEQLLEKIRREKDIKRVFIDGYEGFRSAAIYKDRLPRFLSALTNQLRAYGVTTVISLELNLFDKDVNMPQPEFGSILENVINLRFVEHNGRVYRTLTIMKTRDSDYDPSIREFRISSDGLSLGKGEFLQGGNHV